MNGLLQQFGVVVEQQKELDPGAPHSPGRGLGAAGPHWEQRPPGLMQALFGWEIRWQDDRSCKVRITGIQPAPSAADPEQLAQPRPVPQPR